MTTKSSLLVCLTVLLVAETALGQGLLVDVSKSGRRLPRPIIIYPPHPRPRPPRRPTQSYRIKELSIQAKLKGQVARVSVSQSFVNTGRRTMEVCFVFPLPYDGAIDQLTLMVNGKEYAAKLMSAGKARSIYEGYIRRNRDPALLEWMGMGMFKTSVFPVPPGAERKVTLQYSQLCRKQGGLTEFLFPLSTAKYTSRALERLNIQVSIQSEADIKNVYSPSHSIKIKRSGNRHALASVNLKNVIPGDDFRLFYDVGNRKLGANLLSYRPTKKEDGYFMLLVSPDIKRSKRQPVRKTVIFVVDRSGSMTGKKIEQAKSALKFVLNNLKRDDLFNIVAYDTKVESFRTELQRYSPKSREEAIGFVDGIFAGGSTNIDGALKTAFAQLKDNKQPSYILFLTDGLPTAGVVKESQIVANARQRNKTRARIFNFGVGYDVNSRLLDKLARHGYGQSEYVRPNENIESQVSKIYRRIQSPVLTNVKIEFDIDGKKRVVNRVYPKDSFDLFAGDQLVVVGRYRHFGNARIRISGSVGKDSQSFEFPGRFAKHSGDDSNSFVEKLWAVRRIGEVIDEIDLRGNNRELTNELIHLSKKHGILTPYTSFLADDNVRLTDVNRLRAVTRRNLGNLQETAGASGFRQRLIKGQLQRAKAADLKQLSRRAARSGRGGFGGGGVGGGAAAAGNRGRSRFGGRAPGGQSDKRKATSLASPVTQVGTKTFFRRGDQWVDSVLTAKQRKAMKEIKRYSKAYFALVKNAGRKSSKFFSLDGNVVLVLKDQAYLIKD